MSKEFNEALQSGLDLIRSGGETIDSIVSRYPEFAEELRAQLEVAVWLSSSRAVLDPSPEFVVSSKRRLISKIKQEQQATAAPLTWGERLQEFFTIQKLAPVGFVLALMLGLVVSGTVVSASQKSIPGDNLYSIKRTLEQIALATSIEEQNDAELQIQFVENRLSEVQSLIIAGRYEEVADTLEDTEEQVYDTLEKIEVVSEQNRFLARDLAVQLDELLATQRTILEALTQNSPFHLSFQIARVVVVSEIVKLTAEEFSIFVPPTSTPPPTRVPTRVPTRTPRPTPTPAPTQVPIQPSPTPTTKPTKEPVEPTNTPVPTNTPTSVPTNTPTSVPTSTPTSVPTNTPTQVPTNTPMPTPTPTSVPTNTPPPTNTPTKAPTNTPQPTNTPNPTAAPTNTSVPNFTPTQETNSSSTNTPNP